MTAQFVVIEYDLADLLERIMAAILDVVFYSVGVYILIAFALNFEFISLNAFIIQALVIFLYLIYLMLFEWYFGGQTPGKMLFKIRTVRSNGDFPDFKECLLRSLFCILEVIFTAGTLGIFMLIVTPKRQRLGDLAVDTVVIKNSNQFISSQHLSNLKANDNFETTYPQVTQLKEEYIILLRQIVLSYKKYRMEAQRDLVVDAATNTAKMLGLNEQPRHPIQFLETVIKDYVISTR